MIYIPFYYNMKVRQHTTADMRNFLIKVRTTLDYFVLSIIFHVLHFSPVFFR